MKKFGSVLLAALAASLCSAQIYDIKQGKLEFAGLKRWTPEKIMKELGYESFDKMHSCAAELKQKLGFAEASVVITLTEDKKYHYLVTVVEPEDRARVARVSPRNFVVMPDHWFGLLKTMSKNPIDYMEGVRDRLRQGIPVPEGAPPVEKRAWWPELQQLNSSADLEAAIKIVKQDTDPTDRILACGVLTNFAAKDEAWHALVAAVRDENDMVMSVAYDCLLWMSRSNPRKVDWAPATKDLRLILNGTSLFALPNVIRTLLATEVSPDLARELVGNGGGQMLVPFLKVRRPEERTLAHLLLKRLSGQDYGTDVAKWETWLVALK